MDRLTEAAMLDPKYFEKHADFKDDYKSAAKDDDNNKVDPFDDAVFLQACFEHALAEGTGFHDWLYPLYADVRCQDRGGLAPGGTIPQPLASRALRLPTSLRSSPGRRWWRRWPLRLWRPACSPRTS